METCTVETGLLKKKPCGEASVTHCANCEQPLCAKHAVPQLTGTGKKSGKFMCKECDVAQREHDKAVAAAPQSEKPKAPGAAAAKAPPAPPPAPQANKPAAPAKEAPAEPTKDQGYEGGIDFIPEKK